MSPRVSSSHRPFPRALIVLVVLAAVGAPAAHADGRGDECPVDALATLSTRGLTPSFSPAATAYRAPSVPGDVMEITAAPCDPTVSLQVNGVALRAGAPQAVWVGRQRADVVLYRGWREVGRYAITLDATLPEAPPADGIGSIVVPGLSRRFDAREARYRVPLSRDGFLPVTVTLSDPSVSVYVQGTRVEPGRPFNAWAPRGGRVTVVGYRNWAEIARYQLDVDPELPPLKLGEITGRLYVSGDEDVVVIDPVLGTVDTIEVPNVTETYLLARSHDHARLYVSSTGDHIVSVIGLGSQAVVTQRFFTGDNPFKPAGMTVTPDSERVQVLHNNTGVMATYDKGLGFIDIEAIPHVSMPMDIAYAPGTLDLWVADFSATQLDGIQIAVREPQPFALNPDPLDAWLPVSLPPTQTNADGDSAGGFAFWTEAGLVIASNSRGDELVVIDPGSLEPVARMSVGRMRFWMTLDPASTADHARVFVPSFQQGAWGIYTVDVGPTGGVSLARVDDAPSNPCPSGEYPERAVFGATNDDLYLLCTGSVLALDPSTLAVLESWPLEGRGVDIVWAAQ